MGEKETENAGERQTPKQDFGDRVAGPAEGDAEDVLPPSRIDSTPARLSTNMTIER